MPLIVDKADIYMMLDVNNIYVSSRNHGFDPKEYYNNLPLERVLQIHLAGHSDYGDYVLDTHDNYVRDEVWQIYAEVYPKTEGVSTLLEWDDAFVSFQETWDEALKAKKFQQPLENKQHKAKRSCSFTRQPNDFRFSSTWQAKKNHKMVCQYYWDPIDEDSRMNPISPSGS